MLQRPLLSHAKMSIFNYIPTSLDTAILGYYLQLDYFVWTSQPSCKCLLLHNNSEIFIVDAALVSDAHYENVLDKQSQRKDSHSPVKNIY